ncbi:MAG: BA14K family protein [Hyphomicrobiaceae bacterium]|nr:BA14K family protein [Hyphomicrobiaceae bacterium]
MKKILTIASAALMAGAMLTVDIGQAEARHRGAAFGAGIVAGVVGALIIGNAARGGHHYTYGGHRYQMGHGPAWRHHAAWCRSRYRSWNPHTNLFLSYSGQYRHCRSPYVR